MQKRDRADGNPFQKQYTEGRRVFTLLFVHWMDTNCWTHPTLIQLSRAALDGASWLHSSTISQLRHGNLHSPGPRVFLAITELNRCIHEYKVRKRLLPNTTTDRLYLQAYAITEDGEPPAPGWWFEVFCGTRLPTEIDLGQIFHTDDAASSFSRQWARLTRKLLAVQGYDVVDDLSRAIRDHYPAGDDERLGKLADVLMGRATWTPEEAQLELPALVQMSTSLGGPETQDDLLTELG